MSGIGEVAYTVLLGWMRTVVDWFWSMVSGTGSSGLWQWFLSNWKLWLAVIIVGGLVVDWLMWVVRWRPYRLLFGKARPVSAGGSYDDEKWDSGVGYYEPETAADSEPSDWTDLTMSTLSEIDPDWAGGVVIESDPITPGAIADPYYNEAYEEPPKAAAGQQDIGYWDETPDEADYPAEEPETPQSPYYEDPHAEADVMPDEDVPEAQADYEDSAFYHDDAGDEADYGDYAEAEPPAYEVAPPTYEVEPPAYEVDSPAYEAEDDDQRIDPAMDPFRPYDEQPDAGYSGEGAETQGEEAGAEPFIADDTSPQLYMRPGFWPDPFPFTQKAARHERRAGSRHESPPVAPAPPEAEEWPPSDETASAAPRRRRRKLRESADWHPDDPPPYTEPTSPAPFSGARARGIPDDQRPHRLVQPSRPAPDGASPGRAKPGELRTVTGKPAERRGFMRFAAAQEEPIAGLPPMELTDPFLPAARPDNPDFAPDEGEEFYTEGD